MRKAGVFNQYERYFLIIHLVNLVISLVLLGLFYLLRDVIDIREVASFFLPLTYLGLFVSLLMWGLSLVRLIFYVVSVKHKDITARIRNSVIIFITSPVSTVVWYLLLFIFALSLASCQST